MPKDVPEPCTEEANAQGCTCDIPFAGPTDIDPPEPRRDKHCPLHGYAPDPDDERDRQRERREAATMFRGD